MPIDNLGHEHEFEPQYGLPERLPRDEYLVWQGSPDVNTLAVTAFHIRKLTLYFLALVAVCVWLPLQRGADIMTALDAVKWVLPLAALTLATIWALAFMTARTTVYTITNKRVVLRVGIVLTVTFNLPLKQIASADIRDLGDRFGDITLALKGSDRIAWIHVNRTDERLKDIFQNLWVIIPLISGTLLIHENHVVETQFEGYSGEGL